MSRPVRDLLGAGPLDKLKPVNAGTKLFKDAPKPSPNSDSNANANANANLNPDLFMALPIGHAERG